MPLVHATAGQSIGYFREVRSVGETMDRLVAEAAATLARARARRLSG
ncbi:MAG TPA: hypothetical protein VLX09_17150 [Stellaceae bacterium]|nr:hypothetical protein [Stellaceae bacterium]